MPHRGLAAAATASAPAPAAAAAAAREACKAQSPRPCTTD